MVSLAVKVEVWTDTVSPYAIAVVFLAVVIFSVTLLDHGLYFGSWKSCGERAGEATCTALEIN